MTIIHWLASSEFRPRGRGGILPANDWALNRFHGWHGRGRGTALACTHPVASVCSTFSLWQPPAKNVERKRLKTSPMEFSIPWRKRWAIACACAPGATGCDWSRGTAESPGRRPRQLPPNPDPAPQSARVPTAAKSTTAAPGDPFGSTSFSAVRWSAAAPAERDIPCRAHSTCPARLPWTRPHRLVKVRPNVINLRP